VQGEATRVRAALVSPPAATDPPPQQPVPEAGPEPVVVKRARIRDISAQLLGLGDWREQAPERGQERAEARQAALALLSEKERAAVEAAQARAQEPRVPRPTKKRDELFPAWRRVRPPSTRRGAGPPPRRPRPPPAAE
jgi:hypothetical protein